MPRTARGTIGQGLTLRRNVWFAKLAIPADVRASFGGKTVFIQSTKVAAVAGTLIGMDEAAAVARPLLAQWRTRIEAARLGNLGTVEGTIAHFAAEYRAASGIGDNDEAAALVLDAMDYLAGRFGGLDTIARNAALVAHRGAVVPMLASMTGGNAATALLHRVTGTTTTAFLHHFEAFKASTHLKGKAFVGAVAAIAKFGKAVSEPIETLAGGRHVQPWIDSELRREYAPGRIIKPASVQRDLNGLSAYWVWMQGRDLISVEGNPFKGRQLADSRTGAEIADCERDRFTGADVVKLVAAADSELADFIRLSMYSGIRLNGLASLTGADIFRDAETGVLVMDVCEKSGAGKRQIPVHSAIAELATKLAADAGEGFVFPGAGSEKIQGRVYRGAKFGARFTALKQRLGFGDNQSLHSIRHTVAFQLAKNGTPDRVISNIMGHGKSKNATNVTHRYIGRADIEVMQEAIEGLAYP